MIKGREKQKLGRDQDEIGVADHSLERESNCSSDTRGILSSFQALIHFLGLLELCQIDCWHRTN